MQAANLVFQRSSAVQQQLPLLRLSLAAEYAQLRLQLEYLSNGANGSLPSAADLFRDSSLERLAPGSSAHRNMGTRIRQLEAQLFGVDPPALDSPQFAAAVAELAESEIARLQLSLTRMAQQVQACQAALVLAGYARCLFCCAKHAQYKDAQYKVKTMQCLAAGAAHGCADPSIL
jgi:hypothetical protein